MTDQLHHAIDAVYAAFASVQKPKTIDGCRCCIDDKNVCTLLSKSLRTITPSELSSYASSVFLTVGSEADFRYFLPRTLEILVTTSTWWPDPEVAGRTLAQAQWSKWPAREKESITRLFEVHFDTLVEAVDGNELDSWLCALARAEVPVQPFLGKLAVAPSAALALYAVNANALWDRRLSNAFWDDSPVNATQQIVEWFYSTDISLLILKTYGVDLNLPRQ